MQIPTDPYSPQRLASGAEYCTLTLPIHKSPNDKRDFANLRPVGREVRRCVDINVGSQSDPKGLPGLAHFCEHLLFMGNRKYPNENDYSEYLSGHGGSYNAFTLFDHTNYYFEVGAAHLEGALDRFSQFFISSLFSESCTEREIRAVDSEHKKNLQSDGWRVHQLQRSLSRSDHPYAAFSTGNLETLLETPRRKGLDIRDELLKFYNRYYSANLMKLVVCGKESIQQLTEWVVPRFSLVENRGIAPPDAPSSPFASDSHAKRISVVPVKDSRTLEIQFEIPTQLPLYETKPASYLAHLIGHEGPGSIISLLKRRGWATELCSSAASNHAAFAIFEIAVELTPDGLERTEDILEIIFQYIELIRKVGINQELFDELKSIWDLSFRFQEKSSPAGYASRLAGVMQRPIPPPLILAAPSTLFKFDPTLIRDTLGCLDPRKMRVTVISKSVQGRADLKCEPWYGTQYAIETIDSGLLKRLVAPNPNLHLPLPNPFIPTNFELVATELLDQTVSEGVGRLSPLKHPRLLVRDPLTTLWYHRGQFEVPRVSMCLTIQNPYAYATPRSFACLELLRDIAVEGLAEYGYDAQLAGLGYELDVQFRGITVVVHGYSHKLEKLLDAILRHLTTSNVAAHAFEMCKEKMIRSLRNHRLNAPANHASYFTSYSLLERMWTNDEKATEAPHITLEELAHFSRSFFARAHVEALVVGNYSPQVWVHPRLSLANLFRLGLRQGGGQRPRPAWILPLHAVELPNRRNLLLVEPSCAFVYEMLVMDPSEVNSAIEFYLDIFAYPDVELRAYAELVAHLVAEPAFHQLRTVEQLGYIAFGGIRQLASRGGVRILIQSEREPAYLESRIEAFLLQFRDQVAALSPEAFQSRLKALIEHKLKKDENLGQLRCRYWDSITSRFYDFDGVQTLVRVLRDATQAKTVGVIEAYMLAHSPRRRKFSLHMRSQKLPRNNPPDGLKLEGCGTVIRDLVNWKLTQQLSPAPTP
ncbi:metalloprotease [Massospora cicadina]|nr:metalloprotease [Massospora cicadina]